VVALVWAIGLTIGVVAMARQLTRLKRRSRRAEDAAFALQRAAERAEERAAARVELARGVAAAGIRPRLPLELLAEDGEDVFALRVLDPLGQPGRVGRFVECGAFDGVLRSVTYPFEALGWAGLLVEPQPDEAARCAAARPFSTVVPAALTHPGGPERIELSIYESDALARTAAFQADASGEHYHIGGVGVKKVSVPTMTMDAALHRAFGAPDAAGPIDLVVLDVEGAEMEVLGGFSLDVWRPRLLIVEDLTEGKDTRVRERLRSAGYQLVARVGRNDAFVRGDDLELVQRAKAAAGR
jgi:FkbM family methyltransferase